MKKLLYILAFSCNFVVAQKNDLNPRDIVSEKIFNINLTNEMEFNYVIKGLENSIDNGLDIKKGYLINGKDNFSDLEQPEYNIGNYHFNFANFTRTADSSLAAIIVKATSDVSGRTYWLCIPINNKIFMQKFQTDLASWDESMTTAFAQALAMDIINGKLLIERVSQKVKDPKTQKSLLKGFNLNDVEMKAVIPLFKVK